MKKLLLIGFVVLRLTPCFGMMEQSAVQKSCESLRHAVTEVLEGFERETKALPNKFTAYETQFLKKEERVGLAEERKTILAEITKSKEVIRKALPELLATAVGYEIAMKNTIRLALTEHCGGKVLQGEAKGVEPRSLKDVTPVQKSGVGITAIFDQLLITLDEVTEDLLERCKVEIKNEEKVKLVNTATISPIVKGRHALFSAWGQIKESISKISKLITYGLDYGVYFEKMRDLKARRDFLSLADSAINLIFEPLTKKLLVDERRYTEIVKEFVFPALKDGDVRLGLWNKSEKVQEEITFLLNKSTIPSKVELDAINLKIDEFEKVVIKNIEEAFFSMGQDFNRNDTFIKDKNRARRQLRQIFSETTSVKSLIEQRNEIVEFMAIFLGE